MKKNTSKYPHLLYTFLIILMTVIYMNACSENPSEAEKEIELPESNLNYTDHIFPLFNVKCGSQSGCHSPNFGSAPAQGLDLTSYQDIMTHLIDGSELLVIPFHGEQSFLYNILLEPISGRERMPKNRATLSVNNIVGIKTWIDEGAIQFAQPD